MNQVAFGEFFKEQRIRSGYKSQRKLASVSGVSNGTIARIEAGTQKATIETLRILSKYLTSTSYGEMFEKSGHFEGLTDEKRVQMMSHYDFRIEFTEEFRELIKKMAPSGKFTEEVKQDLVNSIENYVDENFEYTPEALIDLMYEKGDASDMGDLYMEVLETAKKHGVVNENSPNSPSATSRVFDEHIRSFIHLLIGDREHPFLGRIEGEISERIGALFKNHNVKSNKEVTISDKNGIRDDIPDQFANMINDIDNAQFKWDVLQELQDIAHEFHIRFNPAYEVGAKHPRSMELTEVIENVSITYHGHTVTDQDKQLFTAYLDALFRDRISSEK
ncbi:helix-turn-helix transcriptional regulator [Brevibacillus antibioticus]|uniref:Helix-turn-helix transcriptional regulator n=1 Tax=Brevibacillus antibioticus TaxID=2570228 RepID=A0A4U2Y2C2_9BACL|nr:helix-turn-helix transcriptional regulator [Brevibacillus antibioticus]TKI54527.1 helix-turn-helix transcriptional regulator [Brevibacillus antibioticus]